MRHVNIVQYPLGLLTGSVTDDGASPRGGDRSHIPNMCSWTFQVTQQVKIDLATV